MVRSSPGVQRMVAVINFFAEHPDQSFTLTELIRALQLSRATCHMLLAGLVESGYLYRKKDKSYILGPTLAAIGQIANVHFSPLQVAQAEIRELADEFNAICSVYFIEGDEVVARTRAAAMSHVGWPSALGVRTKLRAPFAAIYAAGMSPKEVDTWIDTFDPQPSPAQRQSMHQSLEFAGAHGYIYGVRNFGSSDSRESVKKALYEGFTDIPVSVSSDLDPQQLYSLAYVLGPVFDTENRVTFTLGLVGFDSQYTGAQIEQIGKQVREACQRITHFVQGRQAAALAPPRRETPAPVACD